MKADLSEGAVSKLSKNKRPSEQRLEGLRQDQILSSPLIRALWRVLSQEEQALVLNPEQTLDQSHRYPLSIKQLTTLTGLDEEQLCYGVKLGFIPSTSSEEKLEFEAAGLISAFALTHSIKR